MPLNYTNGGIFKQDILKSCALWVKPGIKPGRYGLNIFSIINCDSDSEKMKGEILRLVTTVRNGLGGHI